MANATIEDAETARAALRKQAQALVEKLYARPDETVITDAIAMLDRLRNEREFEQLGILAEAVSRHRREPQVRRLLAQSLVDRGMATVAADVLDFYYREGRIEKPVCLFRAGSPLTLNKAFNVFVGKNRSALARVLASESTRWRE